MPIDNSFIGIANLVLEGRMLIKLLKMSQVVARLTVKVESPRLELT